MSKIICQRVISLIGGVPQIPGIDPHVIVSIATILVLTGKTENRIYWCLYFHYSIEIIVIPFDPLSTVLCEWASVLFMLNVWYIERWKYGLINMVLSGA